jgi:hypothetical protein
MPLSNRRSILGSARVFLSIEFSAALFPAFHEGTNSSAIGPTCPDTTIWPGDWK